MSELHELSALELGAAVKAREVGVVDLVDHFLDRVTALDDRVGAFVTVTAEAVFWTMFPLMLATNLSAETFGELSARLAPPNFTVPLEETMPLEAVIAAPFTVTSPLACTALCSVTSPLDPALA